MEYNVNNYVGAWQKVGSNWIDCVTRDQMTTDKQASPLKRHCNDVQLLEGPGTPHTCVSLSEDASLFTIITLHVETENPLIFLQVRQSQASDVSSSQHLEQFRRRL